LVFRPAGGASRYSNEKLFWGILAMRLRFSQFLVLHGLLFVAFYLQCGCRPNRTSNAIGPRTAIASGPADGVYVRNPAFSPPIVLSNANSSGELLNFENRFNSLRISAGKGGQTQWDSRLADATAAHLQEMLTIPFFGLVTPGGWDVPTRAVNSGSFFASNFRASTVVVARGYPTAPILIADLRQNTAFNNVISKYGSGRIGAAFDPAKNGTWVVMITWF